MKIKNAALVLPFVGRKKEMEFLKDALEKILNYEGKCVLIEGEVGIGKTRFLKEFQNSLSDSPFQVFSGKGIRKERFMEPFGDMITEYFSKMENRSQRIVRYILPEDLSLLSSISPKLLDYYPFEVPKSKGVNTQVVSTALFNFFVNLAKLYPIVLIIDDAHWLNEETLKFLDYLCCRIEGIPILVVLATRSSKEGLLPQTSIRRLMEILPLTLLSKKAVRNALNILFDEKNVPERFSEWLWRVTKGNPFFIEEIIKSLIKKNLISYENDKWEIKEYYEDFPLPNNIIAFIKDKIKDINQDGIEFLKAVSLLGDEFSLKEAEELLEKFSKERFLGSLHHLELEGILEKKKEGVYAFHHPLVREVMIQGIKKEEKRKLHRKIARIIEKKCPERIEEVVFHKIQELLPEEYTVELVHLLKKTSSLLYSTQNWKRAKEYLKVAKEICSHIPQISEKELLEIEAFLFSLKGHSGEELPPINKIKEFVKKLLSEGLRNKVLDILNIYVRYLMERYQFEEAEEMLNQALNLLKENEKLEQWRLRYLECILRVKQGEYKKAEEEAVKLIKDIDPQISPIGSWFPTNLLGGVAFSYGELEKSKKYYETALKMAQKIGNRDILATSYGNLGLVWREMGDIDKAIQYSQKNLELATEIGNEWKLAKAHNLLASCALLKKDFSVAEFHARRFKTLAQRNNVKEHMLEAGLKLFNIYFEQHRIEEAKKELEELSFFKLESLGGLHQIEFLTTKAMLASEENKLDEALKLLNSAVSICEEKNLVLSLGKVLTERGLCFLKKKKEAKALRDFQKAKEIFIKKGALLSLAKLLVKFGKYRDSLLVEGIEYLKKMGLLEEIEILAREIDRRSFPKSYKKIEKILKTRSIKRFKEEKLKIFTFGGLSVEHPKLREPISEKAWGSKKAKELLGLLLVLSKKKGVTREILSSYLWPDMGPKEAQNNFHVTLSFLRKILGSEGIICEEPFYRLNTQKLWVDYLEFERLYKQFSLLKSQGKMHLAEDRAYKAVSLYQGDFLPEMYLLPIDDEQMILKEKIKHLLLELALVSKERLEWKKVLSNAHRLLQIDPTDERAHRLVMESLYEQGDRSGAIKHYHRLKKILKRELGIPPAPQTIELYFKLKQ